jgi:quercetin dioxygenase-like cupin family protein
MKEASMKLTLVTSSPKLERLKSLALAAMVAALAVVPCAAFAETAPRDAISTAFREAIPNIPGKSMTALVVSYAPGGKSPSHRHARSAFVVGYVLSGAIRSQVDDGAAQVFHAGESWIEKPGAHHRISENASTTEPAKLLAIFVADTNDTKLTTNDEQ